MAKILFMSCELTGDKTALDVVSRDLENVEAVLEYPQWVEFLRSPIIPQDERLTKVKELLNAAGACEITRLFFEKTLVANKATVHIGPMISVFKQLVKQRNNEIEAEVVTAKPMTQREAYEMKRKISESTYGAKVSLSERVDPSLLGGYTLSIGNKFEDRSHKTRKLEILEAMKNMMVAEHEAAINRKV